MVTSYVLITGLRVRVFDVSGCANRTYVYNPLYMVFRQSSFDSLILFFPNLSFTGFLVRIKPSRGLDNDGETRETNSPALHLTFFVFAESRFRVVFVLSDRVAREER